jgi:hypothetical protein
MDQAQANQNKARRVTGYLADPKGNQKIKDAIQAMMELSPQEMAELNKIVNG